MFSVKSTTPSAPPAYGQAPPPGYGQPPPPVHGQAPLPVYGLAPPPGYGQPQPPPPPEAYGQPPSPVHGQAQLPVGQAPLPVYGQAPPAAPGIPFQPNPPGGVPGAWSSGLCDCGADVPLCCLTCWCPCITFGQIAEIVDRGSTSCGVSGALYTLISVLTGCACIYSCFYRTRMRRQYMLPESPCPDCLLHFCCETCALCQEYRELRHRGFDLSIGWHGNVEKQNQGANMAPFVHGGMHR